jgi:hypothetical protein
MRMPAPGYTSIVLPVVFSSGTVNLDDWFSQQPVQVARARGAALDYTVMPPFIGTPVPPPTPTQAPLSIGGPTRRKLEAMDSLSEAQMLAEIEMAQERRRREDDEDAFIILM